MRVSTFVAAATATLMATSVVADASTYPGVFLAPGYLSKATMLGKAAMLSAIRGYTHAAQPGTPIPSAPHCNVAHGELAVSSFDFDTITVTPLNASALTVQLTGIAPLLTTSTAFGVNCTFAGAYATPLFLPQTGSVKYETIFAPTFTYIVTVSPTGGHNVTLLEPEFSTVVDAIPTYDYAGEGFALDIFVASYFKATVASMIHQELTTLLSASSAFANAWWLPAYYALTPFQYVCGTGNLPQYQALELYMQPGCGPNTDVASVESLLSTSDLLLVVPSSSSLRGDDLTARLAAHAVQHRGAPKQHLGNTSNLPATCNDGVPCPPVMQVAGGVSLTFSECVVCYPDNGLYTALAMVVTMAQA